MLVLLIFIILVFNPSLIHFQKKKHFSGLQI